MKKKLLPLAQIALGVAILAYVFANMRNRSDLAVAVRDAARHWPWLLAGVCTFSLCVLSSSSRWHLLMRAQGMALPFRRVIELFFIGHFFNSFLFGATGGDVVKAYFAAVEIPNKKTAAATTVFIDRVIGLLALVLLAVVIMCCRLSFFLAYARMRLILIINVMVLIVTVLGLFMAFRRNIFERYAIFRRIEEGTSLGRVLSRIYNAFHICLRHPGLLVRALILSFVNHTTLVVMSFLIGHALEIDIPFWDYLTVFPIINAVAAIPLTPGGLGTREAIAKWLLGVLGVAGTRAVPLSLLTYGAVLVWSLVGGLVYLGYCARQARAGKTIDIEHLDIDALPDA